MKRKFRTRISCLLIASLCIGLLSATALAADPPAGTVEDPTVIETVTTDTKQDTPAPGQTTTTTTTEKTWDGRDGTEENGTTVKGSETTTETTVTGPDGSRYRRRRREPGRDRDREVRGNSADRNPDRGYA